ncbi:MAG: hypothetical protein U1B83_06510, partial [Candidatus Cloacimonadaceae bacterium]|nr:hypothetical protein [Candidatus Cloacimonadaceae bacterium]
IIHNSMPESRYIGTQWLRIGDSGIRSWETSENTWLIREGKLISFLNSSGTYCLITPLSQQNVLIIPLDGSFDSIFLQDLWFELRDPDFSDIVLRVSLAPSVSGVINDYFNGSPFTLANPWQAFHFEFLQAGNLIETLPNDAWIEFGFRDRISSTTQARLFRIFRNPVSDHLDYKTYGTSYDDAHYSVSSGYVYSGINSSGTYLFGSAAENPSSSSIPHLKANAVIQYAKGYVSWQDSEPSLSRILLEHKALITETHPWLSGQPYTLNSSTSILKLSILSGKHKSATLPANLFLSYIHPQEVQNVINFSADPLFPQFVRYRTSASLEHNTFEYVGGRIGISPAFPGYLLKGQNLDAPATFDLRMYAKMSFDDYEWEALLDSPLPVAENRILRVKRETALPDQYSILANQYQLSPAGDTWSFNIDSPELFFSAHNPFIRIKQSSRDENYLFSEIPGEYYRIYPYPQGDATDPWHFNIADGHISFLLSSNGFFRPMTDTATHLFVNTIVSSNTRDHIVSLYQAQLNVPSSLIVTSLPLNSRVNLIRIPDFQAPIPPICAYRVDFRNPIGAIINPNFYDLPVDAELPYIYVPIPDFVPGENYRLFFRDLNGATTEFVHVQAFSAEATYEYIMSGNCAVGLVDNPGVFYITH